MIIRAITIENFKSIKNPIRIELKPITLIYGPNSVGKSSFLQALHYAHEVFCNSNLDVDRTATGADVVRLGGFANIIHNHDLNNSLKIRLELDHRFWWEEDPAEIKEDLWDFESELEDYPAVSNRVVEYYSKKISDGQLPWFEVEIKQDSPDSPPYIRSSSIGFGNSRMMTVKGFHVYEKIAEHMRKPVWQQKAGTIQIEDTNIGLFSDQDRETINVLFSNEDIYCIGAEFPGNFFNKYSPVVEFSLFYNDDTDQYDDEEKIQENYIRLNKLINSLWAINFNWIREDIRKFSYVGPIRKIPGSKFDPNNTENISWANGLAAWQSMYEGKDYIIDEINYWLSEKRFDTGYEVVLKFYKEVDINVAAYKSASEEGKINGDILFDYVENLPMHKRIFLRHTQSKIELNLNDIGVGISQILPIIPFIMQETDIYALEQPELHIHPAMQMVLGDLIIEGIELEASSAGEKRLIVETHSEHLLLRLLKRLRLNDCGFRLEPGDFSINFMEPSENGVKATRIRVNEEGEFIDPWPRGFFNERAEELF